MKRMGKKNLIIIIVFVITFVVLGGVVYFLSSYNQTEEKKQDTSLSQEYRYFQYGMVKKNTDLYIKNDEKYENFGKISQNVELEFSKLVHDYYLIKGFNQEVYIKASDVKKIDAITNLTDRYKKYILFNQNIVTKDQVSFYDENQNSLYTIYQSYEFNVVIKENDFYGVIYHDRLLFVKKDDVLELKEHHNTDQTNSSGVGVLNYHFFYDENDAQDASGCNEEICVSKNQFKSELEYLKNHGILSVTMKELEWYIDGKVNLPKSVLITIDDGGRTSIAVDLLKEYQDYATIFLVTSWFDPANYYKNEYIELHSHTDNLHNTGVCPGGQGGEIKCLAKETLLDDLANSRKKLSGSTAIAYPFYEYNDYSIEVLKEAGFTMAFAGESVHSDNLVHVGSNKFKLPRFVMVNYTTKENLDKYFNGIK